MNTTRLTQFRRAFAGYDWTPEQRRKYARAWARSLRLLGDKWLGAPAPVRRGLRSELEKKPSEETPLFSSPKEREKQ